MGYIIIAGILIVGGLIFATQAHSALQEIEVLRQSFGGAGGLALFVSDALGATDSQEAITYLQNIPSVSIGAVIVGGLIGLFGIAQSVNSGHSVQRPPESSPKPQSALGSRTGENDERLSWEFSMLDGECEKCGDFSNGDSSGSTGGASYCGKCGSAFRPRDSFCWSCGAPGVEATQSSTTQNGRCGKCGTVFQTRQHTVAIQGRGTITTTFTVAVDGAVVGEYQHGGSTYRCEFTISGYQAYIETSPGWTRDTHKLYVNGHLIA